jgi:hypothetical protein
MRANAAFDAAANLSQAHVAVRLKDGRTLSHHADGARGYPGRLSDDELGTKFLGCAGRSLSRTGAEAALAAARTIDGTSDLSALIDACTDTHRLEGSPVAGGARS